MNTHNQSERNNSSFKIRAMTFALAMEYKRSREKEKREETILNKNILWGIRMKAKDIV